jgi:thymidine kinase
MFAGKTTYLQALVRHFSHSGIDTVFVQHKLNTRGPEGFSLTHSSQSCECITVEDGEDLYKRVLAMRDEALVPVVVIDEAQFFDDLPKTLDELEELGVDVYFGALSTRFDGQPWPSVRDSLHRCTKIKILSAVCANCKNTRARFNHRTVETDQEIVIGGAELYVPLCGRCFGRESH